jgi:hypothetical protein
MSVFSGSVQLYYPTNGGFSAMSVFTGSVHEPGFFVYLRNFENNL